MTQWQLYKGLKSVDYHRLWLEVSNDRALCLFLQRTPGNQGLEQPAVILTLHLWVTQGFFNSPRVLTDSRFRKKESFGEVFYLSGNLQPVQIRRESSSFINICFLTQIHIIHEDTTKLMTIYLSSAVAHLNLSPCNGIFAFLSPFSKSYQKPI